MMKEECGDLGAHLNRFSTIRRVTHVLKGLLQVFGLSRYEIPIDSRITKWLNKAGFAVHLNAKALQDQRYYEFASDGFNEFCKACNFMPCVLDATIFSSYDDGE